MVRTVLVARLRGALSRFDAALSVIGATAAGVWFPALGPALSPLTMPLVAFLVYGSFRNLRLGSLWSRENARLLSVALPLAYVLIPTGAAILVEASPGVAAFGVLVAAAAPTTAGSAIVWTRLGGGDVQGVTVVALATIVLSPALTPAVLAAFAGRSLRIAVVPIVSDLLLIVGGGAVLAAFVPDRTVTDGHIDAASRLAIVLLVYISVASASASRIAPPTLARVAGLAAATTAVGYALADGLRVAGWFDRSTALALFAGGSMKNLGIALLIAGSLGSSDVVAVGVTTFYVTQQLVVSVVTSFRERET